MISDGQMSEPTIPRVGLDGTHTVPDLGRHLMDPVAQVRDFLDESETPPANPLRLVHRSLRGRYLMAAGMAVLFAAVAGTAGFFASSPQFLSNGTIRVSANKPSILYSDQDDTRLRLYDAFVSAEASYLESRPVMERALSREIIKPLAWAPGRESIARLRQSISIERNGSLIQIAGKHSDPESSARIVNALLEAYEELHVEHSRRQDSVREKQLSEREQELLDNLSQLDVKMLEVGQEHGTQSIATAHIHKIAQVEDVDQRLAELTTTIASRESTGQRGEVDTGDAEIKRLIVLDHATADMLMERTRRQAELAVFLAKHAPEHYSVVEARESIKVIDAAIEDRRQQLATLGSTGALTKAGQSSTENSLDDLKALQRQLATRREELREEARVLNSKLVRLDFLKVERDEVRSLLEETRRALEQVRVESQNTLPGTIEVTARGSVPLKPAADKRLVFAAAGSGLGGVGGLAGVAMLGIMWRRYRCSDELDVFHEVGSVVGVLPRSRAVAPPQDRQFQRAIHRMRNELQLLRPSPGNSFVIVVTGSRGASGASTVALELARSFAASRQRTIVVDADLVESELSRRLGLADMTGLREALVQTAWDRQDLPSLGGPLTALPAGQQREVTDEHLSHQALMALIRGLRSHYETIVFDVGSFDERLAARIASALADQVVLVCRCNDWASIVDPIARQLQRTAHGRVGFVHNYALASDSGVRRYRARSAVAKS